MERVTKAKVLGAQDGKAGPLITCGVRLRHIVGALRERV